MTLADTSAFCAMIGPAWLHSTQPGSAVCPAAETMAAAKAATIIGLSTRHMFGSGISWAGTYGKTHERRMNVGPCLAWW
jgi:hypothetical protein